MAAEPAAELAAEPASTPSRPSEGQSRGSALAQSALAVVRPDALGDTVPKLLLILLASFVVMLQSALLFAHDQDAAQRGAEIYALIVGILSMVFIFVYFLFAKKKPASFESFRAGGRAELTAAQLFAIFLFLWWLPGACVLTFYGPYTMTSNSYFASWAAVILSGLLLGEVFRRVEVRDRQFT
jgi:F0F1-type ATP synthase assembly protein I